MNEKINIDEILLQAPDENSPKNILNILNDDCLRKIFKQLHFRDQCSVLSVCVRFNQISKECLAKKQKKIDFNTQTLVKTCYHYHYNKQMIIYVILVHQFMKWIPEK